MISGWQIGLGGMDVFWTETTEKFECFILGGSEVFVTPEIGNLV